ncbi:MAG TPA: 2-succinyl-5-enolpyruvyl-6-hydroxy-3-cyclohexene-1-carboxylic-acid synthase [Thermoleophilaceae bacterium]|jgi:2-succinyl-5-enolpyruvyl-6-hydroxy-3-cyclohexene-1-carboxylate synthase
MIPINRTYAPIQAFVDELARSGMAHAVTSPGSRNAPLVLVLAGEPRIAAHSVIDERCAGFVALGIAKTTGLPVAVTCTSGTAAANLMPAVAEAHESRVPLIVLTADRPPELRDVGAGQAIDQIKLYGSFAKWFVEVGSHEPSRETAVHHRALACRAFATAVGGRPGPVHLNFPLREPLAPVEERLDAADWEGRPDGAPWVVPAEARRVPTEESRERLPHEIASARRGVLVCGSVREPSAVAAEAVRLAAAAGWPVLAEPTSGLRRGPDAVAAGVVAHYDVLLRCPGFLDAHRPELVMRIGETPTSKPLRAWLSDARQVVVDPDGTWHDPGRNAERLERCDPQLLCAELADALEGRGIEPDRAWLDGWARADALVPDAVAAAGDPFEPKVWNAVADAAPAGSTLWVASSMPIRDVESFLPRDAKPLEILANRGANGIDGTVSSATGAALAYADRVFLLIGDVALLHDVGGLLAARRLGVELTVVCANNGGGGIFDFLPVAGAAGAEAYERHIATPSDVDLAEVAALAGLRHVLATTPGEVRAAVEHAALVEVRTDRARNVEQHREVRRRVEAAL